jgi:hypothetical protein
MWDEAEEIAAAWFDKATRYHLERHQGCPWCGGSHCVFHTRRPDREQFSCSACDFFTCHTFADDEYFVTPGESPQPLESSAS